MPATAFRPASTPRYGYALRPLGQVGSGLPALNSDPKKLKQVREDMIGSWSRRYVNKAVHMDQALFRLGCDRGDRPPQIAMGLKTVAGIQKNRTAAREKAPIGPVADELVDASAAVRRRSWPISAD